MIRTSQLNPERLVLTRRLRFPASTWNSSTASLVVQIVSLALCGFAELRTEAVDEALDRIGLELKVGTTVDSILIAAFGSTKNQDSQRNPDMSSTKKATEQQSSSKI